MRLLSKTSKDPVTHVLIDRYEFMFDPAPEMTNNKVYVFNSKDLTKINIQNGRSEIDTLCEAFIYYDY